MKLKRINSELRFNPDKLVTTPDVFSKKTEKVKEEDIDKVISQNVFDPNGLFSKRIFGSLESSQEYSCECGSTHGTLYQGTTCSECGTVVEKTEATIDRHGWIDLQDVYIVKYVAYQFLSKIIGEKNLKEILFLPNKIDRDGEIDMSAVEEIRAAHARNKYYHYGVDGFRENYHEILNYYHELSGKKHPDIYDFIQSPDDVFTNKINVISTILRPAMRTADGLKMDEINKTYVDIIRDAGIANQRVGVIKIIKDIATADIQAGYLALSEMILDAIKSKRGLIRQNIVGSRVNFSSRNIIAPSKSGIKIDEIVLPYQTFLYLFKFELINVISKIKDISLVAANKVWYDATLKFDTEVYKIMVKMIMEDEVAILLNRNPTISYGSILYLKVAGIKKDYSDDTASLHVSILTFLSGDFDGDVLNILSVKDVETREVFKEVFSPAALVKDPNTGSFNKDIGLERDQILGINSLLI